MKTILTLAAAFLSLFGGLAPSATAQLRVVTTIPDLKNIVEEIGGKHVKVSSIAKGTENVHGVALRPSHLVSMSRADMFVQIGLSLEHAFVPTLLEKGRNKKIRAGAVGFVSCAEGWEAIQVPEKVDRGKAADIHPLGNPHMNLDPRAGRHMARRVLEGLIRVDSKNEEAYRKGHAAYVEKLDEAEKRWAEQTKRLKGKKVCAYHRDYDYFARATGLEIIDTVEPKPGVPPKPRDLAETVKALREQGVGVIITARWSNNKDVRFVARKSGAKVVELPVMVHDVKGVDTWIGMMDTLHEKLVEAHDAGA